MKTILIKTILSSALLAVYADANAINTAKEYYEKANDELNIFQTYFSNSLNI